VGKRKEKKKKKRRSTSMGKTEKKKSKRCNGGRGKVKTGAKRVKCKSVNVCRQGKRRETRTKLHANEWL
jgi:hypothetical protein